MVKDQTLARASRTLAGTLQAGLLVTGITGMALSGSLARAQVPSGDAQVQSAVTAALAADPQLKGQQVTATVSQGVVTLGGSVTDDVQRTAAEQTAAQVSGVRSIDDSIGVGAGSTAAAAQEQPSAGPQKPGADTQQPSAAAAQDSASMPPPPPADTAEQMGQNPQQQGPHSSEQQGQYAQQGQYPQQGEYGQQGQYPQQQGQYLQQGQYSRQAPAPYGGYGRQAAPYPVQRGQYAQQPYVPGVSPAQQNGSGPVTLSPGLLLNVRTSEPLSTGRLKTGELVQFTSASDLYANGIVAIPRGAVLTGEVVEAKNAGAFGGSPKLDLKLTSLMLGGRSYSLDSDVWSSQGPSKTGYTATNTIGGAAFGAIIGAIAGGGIGAGVGAVAGGAGGALVSGATHGPRLDLPAEALLQFHLTAPVTVQPVNYNEAERLAATAPQQPVLRTRPVYVATPYPYGYYGRPYYPYPSPYYYGRY